MKKTQSFLVLTLLAIACSPGKSPDIQTTPLQVSSDTITPAINPAPENQQPTTPSDQPVALAEKNIAAFSFLSNYGVKVSLSSDHQFESDYRAARGTWILDGNRIVVIIGNDSAHYIVSNFTSEVLTLTTNEPVAGKLFGEVPGPDNSFRISLNRMTSQAPFDLDVLVGAWSVAGGTTAFNSDETFFHEEPDCTLNGSFKFEGQNIMIDVTENNCDDVNYYLPAKVIDASRRVIIIENTHQEREVWMRNN